MSFIFSLIQESPIPEKENFLPAVVSSPNVSVFPRYPLFLACLVLESANSKRMFNIILFVLINLIVDLLGSSLIVCPNSILF